MSISTNTRIVLVCLQTISNLNTSELYVCAWTTSEKHKYALRKVFTPFDKYVVKRSFDTDCQYSFWDITKLINVRKHFASYIEPGNESLFIVCLPFKPDHITGTFPMWKQYKLKSLIFDNIPKPLCCTYFIMKIIHSRP